MCSPQAAMQAQSCSRISPARSSASGAPCPRRSSPRHPGAAAAAGGSTKPGSGLGGSVPAQHTFARRQQISPSLPGSSSGGAGGSGSSSGSSTTTTRGAALYSAALDLARNDQFERARRVFEATVVECPFFEKAWVSWAQMEKRCIPRGDDTRWAACRSVLQRGLVLNPNAPALLQAWGLMEMQRGNWVAAVLLLDRSARLNPRNMPVLRWKPVVEARKTVGQRSRRAGSSGGDASSRT